MGTAERDELLAVVNAGWTTQAIGAFVRLDGPRALASAPGSTSAALAAATATHEPSMARLLRALATLGLVEQDDAGGWRATATGRLLEPDAPESVAAWAEFCAGASWDTWRHLDDSVRSGQSHRARSGIAGFDHLDADAGAAHLFNRAMRELTRPIAAAFAERVDLGRATRVVDVGGGVGELSTALLVRHAGLHAVVFDRAHAHDAALRHAEERGVAARLSFASGDFFDSVPASADAYLLKSVLHDWSDADCLRILRAVTTALPAAGRVFVIERLVPQPTGRTAVDRMVARSDLNMLVGPGGRERSEEEFRSLLAAAGLVPVATTPLVPAFWSIEARRA